MKFAIFKSIILYLVGFSISFLIYYTADSHYAHGPNLYHFTFALTIFIGIIWLAVATIIYFNKRNRKMFGHILVHGIVTISVIVTLWISFHTEPIPDPYEPSPDQVYTARTGDSIMIYHNDNLIYLEIADSIYLDFRDSTMITIDLN